MGGCGKREGEGGKEDGSNLRESINVWLLTTFAAKSLKKLVCTAQIAPKYVKVTISEKQRWIWPAFFLVFSPHNFINKQAAIDIDQKQNVRAMDYHLDKPTGPKRKKFIYFKFE